MSASYADDLATNNSEYYVAFRDDDFLGDDPHGPFYSCRVEPEGLGSMRAAVMLAGAAVVEDPDGGADRGCQAIWLWPSGRFRRIL